MEIKTGAKKTPLYEQHVDLSGKIVEFAGFMLPIQYKDGVIKEHMAVREHAGLFDVSHMGEVILQGEDALLNLNYIMTNSFDDMQAGACRYTLMLNENGGQVDDLIVYKMNDDKFLLVLNAANVAKDINWIKQHLKGNCTLLNTSDDTAQIAIQGPFTNEIMNKIGVLNLPQKNYTFKEDIEIAGINCLVSCTGYTGEFGYEIYMPNNGAPAVWQALIGAGAKPCGLACRDTLRLEAAMPLYGHELNEDINAVHTGLNFAIKTQKESFIGKKAIEQFNGEKLVRIGLKAIDKGIVRENDAIYIGGVLIGKVTSGTHCPYIGSSCAMAYIEEKHSGQWENFYAEVRGRKIKMERVKLPFYKRQSAQK